MIKFLKTEINARNASQRIQNAFHTSARETRYTSFQNRKTVRFNAVVTVQYLLRMTLFVEFKRRFQSVIFSYMCIYMATQIQWHTCHATCQSKHLGQFRECRNWPSGVLTVKLCYIQTWFARHNLLADTYFILRNKILRVKMAVWHMSCKVCRRLNTSLCTHCHWRLEIR